MVQGDDGGQRVEKITKAPHFRLEVVSNECLNFSRPFETRPIVAGSFQPTLFLPDEPQAHKPPALGVSLFRDEAAQAATHTALTSKSPYCFESATVVEATLTRGFGRGAVPDAISGSC